jgi:hypothetical protein
MRYGINARRIGGSGAIITSLPRELLEKITKLAQRKGLSRASYIRMVLTEHVAEQDRRGGVTWAAYRQTKSLRLCVRRSSKQAR